MRSGGSGGHGIVDLEPGDAHPPELVLDPQVRGMDRVGVESLLALELGVEDDVAGVVDATVVQTHFEMKQPRHFAADTELSGSWHDVQRSSVVIFMNATSVCTSGSTICCTLSAGFTKSSSGKSRMIWLTLPTIELGASDSFFLTAAS